MANFLRHLSILFDTLNEHYKGYYIIFSICGKEEQKSTPAVYLCGCAFASFCFY